jgi:hypothetical protein
MSLDTGLIAKKYKNSWKIYEINLSTRKRSFVEELKTTDETKVMDRMDELDKKIAGECGQPYEGIWIERTSTSKKITEKEIDNIKADTAKSMREAIEKLDVGKRYSIRFYTLDSKKNMVPSTIIDWSNFLQKKERIVKQDKLMNGYFISTVFLGIDHNFIGKGNPLLFETIVFDTNSNTAFMHRYSTYKNALKGHEIILKKFDQIINWTLIGNNLLELIGLGGKNGKPRI